MDELPNKPHECKIEINPTETAKPSQPLEESFFDKNKTIKIAVMLAIIIFAASYIRFYEASMPALDTAAKLDITYLMIEQVKAKMYNPIADPAELNREMQETIKRIYQEDAFKKAVKDRASAYKQLYYDSSGDPYLVKADPYYYLRQARNIVEGNPDETTLFPYIIAYSYKLSPYSLIKTAYYLPLAFAVLTCIVAFFLTAKISDYWGGFIAGFLLAVHPIFLDATALGDADTQIITTFFSLLTAYFFVLLLKSNKNVLRGIYACLLLASIYLFKSAWATYYYIVFILIASLITYILLQQLKTKTKTKWIILPGLIGVCIMAVLYLLTTKSISHILQILYPTNNIYPTSLSYTQELQTTSLVFFIARINVLILLIATIIVIYVAYLLIKKPEVTNIFMLVWFAGTGIFSFLAIRLLMFVILPVAVIVGYGISKAYPHMLNFPKAVHLRIPKKRFAPILAVMLAIAILITVQAELKEMTKGIPHRFMDDSIEKITKMISIQTNSNAVINDWWDLGHIYRYYARRNTITDGATLDSPDVYWFAKALTSANETEAVNILHMIDCGMGNRITAVKPDSSCTIPAGVIIVSDYVIKQNQVVLKTAEWDFRLASIYNQIKDLNQKEAISQIKQKYPDDNAEEIYGHMTQYTDALPEPKIKLAVQECTRKEKKILCGNYNYDAILNTVYGGTTEYSFAYITETNVTRKDIGTDKIIIIYTEDRRIRYAVVDSEFMDSLLVKLYFFEAKGMKHFKLLDKALFAYTKKIKAFQVDWVAP